VKTSYRHVRLKEALIESFDRPVLSQVEGLRTNGNVLVPFVVSLSNHERNQLDQSFLKRPDWRDSPEKPAKDAISFADVPSNPPCRCLSCSPIHPIACQEKANASMLIEPSSIPSVMNRRSSPGWRAPKTYNSGK
jgi:hypothetical protein